MKICRVNLVRLVGRLLCLATLGVVAMDGPQEVMGQDFNYDESKVPEFELPALLVDQAGKKVTTAEQWTDHRRDEVLELFAREMFGRVPSAKVSVNSSVIEESDDALDGKAKRKQVKLQFTNESRPDVAPVDVYLLMYLPADVEESVPVFVAYNFYGNHTIHADPEIKLNPHWMRDNRDKGVVENRATEESRGTSASRWSVDEIIANGFGLVTLYYGDIDPDFDDGFHNGIHRLFYGRDHEMEPDAWGSIASWAWGLSRVMDYFETDPAIDAERVAVLGHSRLGKTSLWAGATDQRFALVISNDSGCGGAALSRRRFGETVERINTSFPHWFCDNFQKYNSNEDDLPLDQHMLIALMAPRPVYVASAEEDQWADPRGEFLSAAHADPVYRLLTKQGIESDEMPEVNKPYHSIIGYHVRSGGHDVKPYDWQQYLAFAKKWMK